ncbi:alpha/beta hydrolase [Leptospira hartskeerlii]|uniref:Alpha/beta hydrolase n=1 Tax=Leptospira hartskeerlii TaxID=2023177 RepID=A0A2M9X9Y2_9LEPT|nr:alpha/beta hydrolase [Leptospira hartskeerlii]PJZ24495.1 alpha/beta hydrolase [Leptospira hartskeerlii]PJZ32893.1 alpha/beta hydrolase [Leptospira hartskeerlii]
MIRYSFQGFPFLLKYADMIDSPDSEIQEENLKVSKKSSFRTKIFPGPENSPVIYLQHGMSNRGIDDPRILTLAKHLKNTGATVYLPELPEVKGLEISVDTVPNIRALFQEIVNREGRAISFLSASFSAGMGMVALSGKEEQKNLKSALLVGTYSDFADTLPFILSNYDVDPYAVHVLLYNYISKLRPKLSKLEEFYFEAALDNGLKRTGDEEKSSKLLQKLGQKEKDFVYRVQSDPGFRMGLVEPILSVLPPNFILRNSPKNFLSDWKAPIALLHGSDDAVISPDESEQLFDSLGNGKEEWKVILRSKLITHGDHLPFYTQLGEIPKLAGLWGFFLKNSGL